MTTLKKYQGSRKTRRKARETRRKVRHTRRKVRETRRKARETRRKARDTRRKARHTRRKTKRKMKGGYEFKPPLIFTKEHFRCPPQLLITETDEERNRELTIFGFWVYRNQFPIQIEIKKNFGGMQTDVPFSVLSNYTEQLRKTGNTFPIRYLVSVNGKRICDKQFADTAPASFEYKRAMTVLEREFKSMLLSNDSTRLEIVFDSDIPPPLLEPRPVINASFEIGRYVEPLEGPRGLIFNAENLLYMYRRGLIFDPQKDVPIVDFVYDTSKNSVDFKEYFYKCRGESVNPHATSLTDIMEKHTDPNRCMFVINAHAGISGAMYGKIPEQTDLVSFTTSTRPMYGTYVHTYPTPEQPSDETSYCIECSYEPYRDAGVIESGGKKPVLWDIYQIAKLRHGVGEQGERAIYLFQNDTEEGIVPHPERRYYPCFVAGRSITLAQANIQRLYTSHNKRVQDMILVFGNSEVFTSVPFMPKNRNTSDEFPEDIGCWLQNQHTYDIIEPAGISFTNKTPAGPQVITNALPISTGITIFSPKICTQSHRCIQQLHASVKKLVEEKGGIITKPIIKVPPGGDLGKLGGIKSYIPGQSHLERDGFTVISGITGEAFITEFIQPGTRAPKHLSVPSALYLPRRRRRRQPKGYQRIYYEIRLDNLQQFSGTKMYIMVRFPENKSMMLSDLCINPTYDSGVPQDAAGKQPIFGGVPGTWYNLSCKTLLSDSKNLLKKATRGSLQTEEEDFLTPLTRAIQEMSGRYRGGDSSPENPGSGLAVKFTPEYFPYNVNKGYNIFHQDIGSSREGVTREAIIQEIQGIMVRFIGKGKEDMTYILHHVPLSESDFETRCNELNQKLTEHNLWVIGGKFIVGEHVRVLIDCLLQCKLINGEDALLESLFNKSTVELANLLFDEPIKDITAFRQLMGCGDFAKFFKPKFAFLTQPETLKPEQRIRLRNMRKTFDPLEDYISRMYAIFEIVAPSRFKPINAPVPNIGGTRTAFVPAFEYNSYLEPQPEPPRKEVPKQDITPSLRSGSAQRYSGKVYNPLSMGTDT